MKLSELKPGDTITHYCSGELVTGTIVSTNGKTVITKHEPVIWGRDTYTKTVITESSELQKKYGGTDKDGNPCKGPDTTPGAFYKGERITV